MSLIGTPGGLTEVHLLCIDSPPVCGMQPGTWIPVYCHNQHPHELGNNITDPWPHPPHQAPTLSLHVQPCSLLPLSGIGTPNALLWVQYLFQNSLISIPTSHLPLAPVLPPPHCATTAPRPALITCTLTMCPLSWLERCASLGFMQNMYCICVSDSVSNNVLSVVQNLPATHGATDPLAPVPLAPASPSCPMGIHLTVPLHQGEGTRMVWQVVVLLWSYLHSWDVPELQ